jgi:hypothetical protein
MFANNGGTLECEAPANSEDIPDGNFKESCGGCKILRRGGETLMCSHCRTPDGGYTASFMAVNACPEGSITNKGGALACGTDEL